MDTDGLLSDLNEFQWGEVDIFPDDGQMQTMQGIDANLPQCSAYIFSVVSPGPLPKEFWQDKQQHSSNNQEQLCSVFKVNNCTHQTTTFHKVLYQVLYHFHLSLKEIADNPQDTLR